MKSHRRLMNSLRDIQAMKRKLVLAIWRLKYSVRSVFSKARCGISGEKVVLTSHR